MTVIAFIKTPSNMKSVNLYPPGPYTSKWVGEPIGVAKLAVEIIKEIMKGAGLTPNTAAVCNAIGKKIAAAAVFDMNSLNTQVAEQITIKAI